MCDASLPPHGYYLVRIDVLAEPTVPAIDSQELEELDLEAQIARLIRELETMNPDDAQDQVHRRFQYVICVDCQRELLGNPLGIPRRRRNGYGEN
jgi:hypothetical protein